MSDSINGQISELSVLVYEEEKFNINVYKCGWAENSGDQQERS